MLLITKNKKKIYFENIFLCVFLSILCLFFIYRVFNLCFYPFPLENGEGICAHFTQLLNQWNLYKDLSGFPLIVANYPPVFMVLNSILMHIFSPANPFIIGRLISVLSVIGSCILIFKIVYGQYGNFRGAIASVLIFIIFPWVNIEGIICRVDMLAGFFSLAGFYFIFKEGKKNIIFSIIFFLLSLFTKHTLWAAPIAGFTFLVLKNKKEGLKFTFLFLFCGLMCFILLNLTTSGEFYNNLIKYNAYTFEISRLFLYIKLFLHKTVFIYGIVAYSFLTKKRVSYVFRLYFLVAMFSIFLTGRQGSSSHYFYEATFALCIICGAGLSQLPDNNRILRVLFLILIIAQLFINKDIFSKLSVSSNRYISDKLGVDQIKKLKGPVLAEDTGILIAAGKTVYVHTFAISKLIEQGILDSGFYYTKLENNFFKMVVLDSRFDRLKSSTRERFTKESLLILSRNYKFLDKIGSRYFYVPTE